MFFGGLSAEAVTPVQIMKTKSMALQPSDAEIAKVVTALIDVNKYREVKVQLIHDEQGKPSHYLVYLHSKTLHRVDFARIPLDQKFNALSVEYGYKLQPIDFK